jgi:hypothetical protein
MLIQNNKFYYGIPQELWDDLLIKADDLLIEEEIGTHILGIYPAGNRNYGIESESQSLLCIYLDIIDNLINPFHKQSPPIKSYRINNQGSCINYIELYNWTKLFIEESNNLFLLNQFNLIPTFYDCLYQDNVLDNIISVAQEILLSKRYISTVELNPPDKVDIDYFLYYRTLYIWNNYNKFVPNINPEFGNTFNVDIDIDKIICNKILNGKNIKQSEIFDTIKRYQSTSKRYNNITISDCLINQLSSKMINLYKNYM